MNELFRFVAIAPPQKKLPVFVLRLAFESSPFIIELLAARTGDNPREAMIQAAHQFKDSEDFIADPTQVGLFEHSMQLEQTVGQLEQIDLDDLHQEVIDAFGESAQAVRSRPEFQNFKRRLSDSIIALMIAPSKDVSLLPTLSQFARIADLVDRIARSEPELAMPGAMDAVLSEALIIPETFFPLPPPLVKFTQPEPDPAEEKRKQKVQVLQERASKLRGAIKSLLATTQQDLRPRPTPSRPAVTASSSASAGRSGNLLGRLFARTNASKARAVQGDELNVPDTSRESRFLRSEVIARFAPEMLALLTNLDIDVAETAVPTAVARLETELVTVGEQLNLLEPAPGARSIIRLGSTFVPVHAQPVVNLGFAASEGSGIPETVGSVRPIGVGNLLLVRQQIKAYEAGEMAHIENVLRGESKERGTRRLERTEEMLSLITETTKEEERDLQTTERFELQQETAKTIQQDESFNVGVSVSAGYGPFFQVNSNVGFSSATSATEAAKKAFSYAKDVTDRSVSRISERIRREETIRTLHEFEETNKHGLNNVGGNDHVIGIYQWVDKIYESQVFDYGRRTLFSFMIPEPASLYIKALEAQESEIDELQEPEPFDIRPSVLNEINYGQYVTQYRVKGVEPPPPAFITVSRSFDASAATPGADFTKSDRIEIPDGYYAWQAHVSLPFIRWTTTDGTNDGDEIPADTPVFRISVGREHFARHSGDSITQTLSLDDERESIPIAILTLWAASYAANIEIECKRDDRRFEKWQLETHATIMQAYETLQSEYEEKLAAAAARAGVQIEGQNPLENRLTERTEIKRNCISLLTAQHFDLFGAILESPNTLPRIDFDEAAAEGRYIQFFEQAFEWENMTYIFYPYFWGRKSRWLDRIVWRDVDPTHAEFLKAGAARAVIPVRSGFDAAVLHYLDTGQVWNGGDIPPIGNPLYVDILEEVRERQKAPGKEIPIFESWDVRLPTTLVRLAPDSALPRWEKDEAGNWHPAETE